MIVFDYRKFMKEQVGPVPAVVAFLSAYGAHAPNIKAVEKWYQRNSIPADWFAVLLTYLELEHGQPVKLAKYLQRAS